MRKLLLSCALISLLFVGDPVRARASIYTFVGSGANAGNSATADFTFNAGLDLLTIVLTNTSASTLDAGDLFTGIKFSVGGLGASLVSDQGKQRSVDAAGVFTDTLLSQDLSWSLTGVSSLQLDFNPNAKDAIIGPPTAGTYAAANGSIKDNNGHDPFAAQVATFVLSVPGLLDSTPLTVTSFLFGTGKVVGIGTITVPGPDPDPDGEPSVPEPSSLAVFSLLAMVSGAGYWRSKKA